MSRPRESASERESAPLEAPAPEDLARRVRRLAAENRRLFGELAQGERRLRRLSRAVWQIQEDEQRRVARELHDGVGQLLVALKSRLELLARGAAAVEGEGVALTECARMAGEALEQTRELSRLLRPTVLDDLGLVPALEWLARTLGERSGLEVELDTAALDGRLDPQLETLIFRVVQEGLTNVFKHSGSGKATVTLGADGASLRLSIRDAGRGFDAERYLGDRHEGRALGLRSIQDRVALFAGRVRIESAPGRGTALEVEIPLDAGEDHD